MRGKEDTQSVYLSQPIWRLVPGGAGIFPMRGTPLILRSCLGCPSLGYLLEFVVESLAVPVSSQLGSSFLQKHLLALHTNSHLRNKSLVRRITGGTD